MNINLVSRVSIRVFYALVLALVTVVPSSSCVAQSRPKTPDEPIAQTSPGARNAEAVKCQSPEEIENLKRPLEWKGNELNRAVIYRDIAAVKNLLRQKVNLDEKDNFGDTPLINAVSVPIFESKAPPGQRDERLEQRRQKDTRKRLEITRLLLKNGADANLRDEYGRTAVLQLASRGYTTAHDIEFLTLLIEHQADVDLQDNRGFTALMAAAQGNKPVVVKFLLNHNANRDLTNCDGQTALSIAEAQNSAEIVSLLKQ